VALKPEATMNKTMIRFAALAALGLAAPVPVQAQTPAPPAAMKAEAKPAGDMKPMAGKKDPSPGQLAARERQKTCSMEWKTAKKDKSLAPGTRWPSFWHECNARLKGKGA
jgi:hypothetical protein